MKYLKLLGILAFCWPICAAADAKFSDPEIAAIVVHANQVDIDAGKLAKEKAGSSEVKSFAEKMVTDHKSVNEQAVALAKKLNVTPKESDTSKKLSEDGEKTRARLAKLEGADFDKAYVDNEVAYHEAVIGVIKDRLIPEASNKELKDLLVKSSPAFIEHLEHAKALQKKIGHK